MQRVLCTNHECWPGWTMGIPGLDDVEIGNVYHVSLSKDVFNRHTGRWELAYKLVEMPQALWYNALNFSPMPPDEGRTVDEECLEEQRMCLYTLK